MKSAWWTKKEDLDEDQLAVLRLPADGSYLVTGPPGSGKTNLVILRAKYLIQSGRPNVRVVVFTRSLKEFIAFGSGEYGIPPELVTTLDRFFLDFLLEQGVSLAIPDGFVPRREYLLSRVEETIEERQILQVYDTVLIDESQDLWPREVTVLATLARHLFAVADARQKIYSGGNPVPTIASIVKETLTLRFHYRNGAAICRLADLVGRSFGRTYRPLEPDSQYDDADNPSEVREVVTPDIRGQLEQVIASLKTQLKSFPGELLGILCPTKELLPTISNALTAGGLGGQYSLHGGGHSEEYSLDRRICVSTMHSSKGLEFRALHLVDLDGLHDIGSTRRNVAYTSITRAKTSLTAYHCGHAPPWLLQAFRELEPPAEPPELDDLFLG